jgi:DNA mismatch endonuclease (patch repair protein)
MDRHTRAQRSYNMSRVKSKNTQPELLLRKTLYKLGFRYRIHYRLPGKPDVVFLRAKVVVFVDGEWWHGRHYDNQKSVWPEFWQKKIGENIARDRKNRRLLRQQGWKVIRIWDKELKKDPKKQVNKIIGALEEKKQSLL